MLVFNASEELWDEVQCMSVSDSFTSSRACCTCGDPFNCPYDGFSAPDPPYCAIGEDVACTTKRCKQLAAGCGVSLFDLAGKANGGDGSPAVGIRTQTVWGEDEACTQEEVSSGVCGLCEQPLWCDDPASTFGSWGSIRTPEEWVDEFFDQDGGRWYGARQCKWKPSQKQTFIDTIKLRFERRETVERDWRGIRHDHANAWNEVNFYVDHNDTQLAQLLWKNLVGIVFVRTAGSNDERIAVGDLAAHWRALGRDVPMYEVDAEELEHANKKKLGVPVDLLAEEYGLREIPKSDDFLVPVREWTDYKYPWSDALAGQQFKWK